MSKQRKELIVTQNQLNGIRKLIEDQMNGRCDRLLVIDARNSINVKDINSGKTIRP